MGCIAKNFTEDQIRDALLNKKIQELVKGQSVEEKARVMRQMNKMVGIEEISASELTAKKRRDLGLAKDDMVPRYVLEVNGKNELLAKGRTSDLTAKKIVKDKGILEAHKMSNLPNNVLKALIGTKLHKIAELTMNNMIEAQSKDSNIMSLSDLGDSPKRLPGERIREVAGLTEGQYEVLKKGLGEILDTIKDTQRKIDPKGKAILLPEQFVYNPVTDTGSTIDLLILFSDGTHGNIDYKSISAAYDKVQKVGTSYNIIESNWIPKVKMDSFQDQLDQSNDTLEKIYGSKGVLLSRVVPIHIKLENKKQAPSTDDNLTEKIEFLNIGYKRKTEVGEGKIVSEWVDEHLSHIPVREMVKMDDPKQEEKIREQINILTTIINNREIRLGTLDNKSAKYTKLKQAIAENKKALRKVILDQDFGYLILGYEAILRRLAKDGKLLSLDNINQKEINGKENPNYLTTSEITELTQELQAFKNILEVSVDFQAEFATSDDIGALEAYKTRVKSLSFDTSRFLRELEDLKFSREISPDEQKAFNNLESPNWLQRIANTLGEQDGIPFRMLKKVLEKAQSRKAISVQTIYDKLTNEETGLNKKLSEYGKRIGKSLGDVFDMLIDSKTENLHSKYSSKFWEDFSKARFNKDAEWIDKHLVQKPDAKESFKQNYETFIATGYKLTEREKSNWKKFNSLNNIKFSNRWWLYYDLKDTVEDSYHSDGYKQIREVPELLEYWKFYTETMGELNNMLGLRGNERKPDNFLAYIRQDLKDIIAQGTFDLAHVKESVQSIFQLREDDSEFGNITETGTVNPITGEVKSEIPRHYINPIKDNKGRVMNGMKLRDISKSLVIYAEMAYNYHFMKTEVEPHVEAIKDYLLVKGIRHVTDDGKPKKWLSGIWAKKKGDNHPVAAMYDKFVKHHLYGIKIQNATKQQAKILQKIKGYQSDKELALSPLLWIGSFIYVTGNAFFEGHGGFYYRKRDMAATMLETAGAYGKDLYLKNQGLGYLFEFYPGAMDIRKKNMSAGAVEKYLTRDTLHIGMRKSEQVTDNNIGISILKTHALVDGKMVRLANAPKGTKSIYEQTSIKNGRVVIEGLTDDMGKVLNYEHYSAIREYGLSIVSRIKGQMNPNDLAIVHMTLEGAAFMGFKTWLPPAYFSRFGRLRYNRQTDSIVNGMYAALAANMSREDQALFSWLGNVVAPTLLKFSLNMATFGGYNFVAGQFGDKYKFKVNEIRARRYFEAYKEKFADDKEIQALSFDEFLAYQQSQLRRLAAELSAILAITASVIALRSDWDDDGEADWKKNWYTRTLFRSLNRGRRELAFFMNPGEWESFFRMPIPIMTLPIDAYKALTDALSGIGDIVQGEPATYPRGKSKFYEALKFVQGHKSVLMFEAFSEETAKLREI